jgi:hypothetical protein
VTIPRDVNGTDAAKALRRLGFEVKRANRLTSHHAQGGPHRGRAHASTDQARHAFRIDRTSRSESRSVLLGALGEREQRQHPLGAIGSPESDQAAVVFVSVICLGSSPCFSPRTAQAGKHHREASMT